MAFEVTITEIRKKTILVHNVDYDFEAERKIEEKYLSNLIDMDNADVTDWKINVMEV